MGIGFDTVVLKRSHVMTLATVLLASGVRVPDTYIDI